MAGEEVTDKTSKTAQIKKASPDKSNQTVHRECFLPIMSPEGFPGFGQVHPVTAVVFDR